MAHFRAWVKWASTGGRGEEEAMRLACHTALDDLLRQMKRKRTEPATDHSDHHRKLELIINAGAE